MTGNAHCACRNPSARYGAIQEQRNGTGRGRDTLKISLKLGVSLSVERNHCCVDDDLIGCATGVAHERAFYARHPVGCAGAPVQR
jgi:hypothetical protein